MNDLESLANLGEIVGAIAVVVSLIYLAIQVRQNTQAQRTENFSRALERVAAIQASLSQDTDTAVLISKGVTDVASLTSKERIQFTWAMYELFGAFEFIFFASRSDEIPDEVWHRWEGAAKFWLSFPGVRDWWSVRPIPFTVSFSRFVQRHIDNMPAESESAARYRDFIQGGSPEFGEGSGNDLESKSENG